MRRQIVSTMYNNVSNVFRNCFSLMHYGSRNAYEAECHRKDGVIAALRDEVVDLKGALQSSGSFRYICSC